MPRRLFSCAHSSLTAHVKEASPVWNHKPLCVGDEHWTANVTEKEPIVSHGTCHNFPCYFSAAQGIAVVLVGLVLLYILFCGLKNLFFSLAL